MVQVEKYNLPDFEIFQNGRQSFKLWIPDKIYIILGASNTPEDALNIDNIQSDKITVYKRPSGGQTVVLTPKTLVISVFFPDAISLHPLKIFYHVNTIIIKSLAAEGIENLSPKGISDIAISDKKILGSSIYKSKEKIFYHAVLNFNENPDTFDRYLKHPKREPDYRKGRIHKDFVTSIVENDYKKSMQTIADSIKKYFRDYLFTITEEKE